jgi:hypothetical protein
VYDAGISPAPGTCGICGEHDGWYDNVNRDDYCKRK